MPDGGPNVAVAAACHPAGVPGEHTLAGPGVTRKVASCCVRSYQDFFVSQGRTMSVSPTRLTYLTWTWLPLSSVMALAFQ